MRATRDAGMRNWRRAARAASAKAWPRRKLSCEICAAVAGAPSAMRRISARRAEGRGRVVCLRSLGGTAVARATSMASAEVPDIRPRRRRGLLGMWIVFSIDAEEMGEVISEQEAREEEV